MPEYTWINRVLNMPEYVWCIRYAVPYGHCTSYWAVVEAEAYSEYCHTFKMEHFAKTIVPECIHVTRSLQGRGSLMKLGHFNKHFAEKFL